MKKLVSACMFTALSAPAFLSASAFADVTPLLKFYGGAGSWSADLGGDLGSTSTDVEDLGFDKESNGFFYVGFEHPVPLIPNIRLERSSISSKGSATLTQDYTIGGEEFASGSEVDSSIDLTFTDATLYYEILLVDFGLTLRQLDAEVSATSPDPQPGGTSETEEVDGVLPMVYLATQIDLPFSGVYIGGNVNAISFDGKSIMDFRGGVGYGLELGPVAELGLELGYRSLTIDVGDDEDFEGEIDLSGVYFGLNVTF